MFIWSEEYRLHHPVLDGQHAVLFGLLVQLDDAAEKRALPVYVGDLVRGLKTFAQYHLRCEEIMMEEAGYPKLAEHCAQHVRLMDAIEDMQIEDYASDLSKAVAGRDLVANWLATHIRHEDADFVRFVESRS